MHMWHVVYVQHAHSVSLACLQHTCACSICGICDAGECGMCQLECFLRGARIHRVCIQCICSKLVGFLHVVCLCMHECMHVETVQPAYGKQVASKQCMCSVHKTGLWYVYGMFGVCMQGECHKHVVCVWHVKWCVCGMHVPCIGTHVGHLQHACSICEMCMTCACGMCVACTQCNYHVLTTCMQCAYGCVWCAWMRHVCTLYAACVWHACVHMTYVRSLSSMCIMCLH